MVKPISKCCLQAICSIRYRSNDEDDIVPAKRPGQMQASVHAGENDKGRQGSYDKGSDCPSIRPHLRIDEVWLWPRGDDFRRWVKHLADGVLVADAQAQKVGTVLGFHMGCYQ